MKHIKKILPAVFFFCSLFSLFGRDIEITVVDVDLGLPLEGAVVRSFDGTQYVCDRNGKARIAVPDDRQVVIQGSYPGYENGRLVVTAGAAAFTMGLRLSGIMENRELVIEAERPDSSETRTGRSVALSGRDIAQTGEIGIIEDVMSSIKLLPGVGYAGFFNAVPSIRGGDPMDTTAALDGYYIFNPYYWGGGFSIFDPRMVQSARLSHGVFSTRYGNTISGILEITSKKPSSTETEFELGASTSAASFNLSLPLNGKGGLLFMGRVTYYDPFIWAAKQAAKVYEALDAVNSIRVAPYIRGGTITGNYRFLDNLELQATGFWGMDGIGVTFENSSHGDLDSDSTIRFDWTNYQGFITAGLLWNPRNDMLLKFTAGTGYEDAEVDGDFLNNIYKKYFSSDFLSRYSTDLSLTPLSYYDFKAADRIKESIIMVNAQGRIDYDWEIKEGLIAAAGIQEMFSRFTYTGKEHMFVEKKFVDLDPSDQAILQGLPGMPVSTSAVWNDLRVIYPYSYDPDVRNNLFTTSGYALTEFSLFDNRIKTELGLRVDHFYLQGRGFSLQSKPALNPRLNVDVNLLENKGILQSLDLSAGTGLFSSIDNTLFASEKRYNMDSMRPSRSWTSILGIKLEFPEGLSFNIEGYYKHVFDRMYVPIDPGLNDMNISPRFDGIARAWGIDIMLQKLQSRYWDGWLSYSFSWVRVRDPHGIQDAAMNVSGGDSGDDWYFPSYHRFHNLNLVVNFKPTPRFNIYTRFGFASGVQLPRRTSSGPTSYPALVYDPTNPEFIEKYYWPTVQDENNRTTPSFPMDIKFSIFGSSKKGKARYEIYVAIENVLALLYTAQGNNSFNEYTGKVDTGSDSKNYEIPIPIPSFGFKISY